MASAAAAQVPAPPPAQPDWLTLPLELLQRCLSHLADKRAAFRSCRRFARAVLLHSLQQEETARLRWDVDHGGTFGSAKLVQALVGEQGSKGLALVLFSDDEYEERFPERCLAELRASGVALTCITRLEMQGLALGALIADGTSTLLPNLRQLRISDCQLTAAAAESLVDTACGRLQHVEVEGLTGEDRRDVSLQLMQLAGLPSLTSVSLLDRTCPTQFLNTLDNRLTALHLDKSYRQVQPRTQTPTIAWRSTLQLAARCTALRSLTIPCVTSEELGLVAPALQQLRRLHLNGTLARADGDAVVERLLGLPHLNSLRWEDFSWHTFQRSHASSPCRWSELSFEFISPHQLACLPLHSLTSPVAWGAIVARDGRAAVAELQAAVDNATRRCPAGVAWRPQGQFWPTLLFLPQAGGGAFTRGAGEGDSPEALLRALQPLLAAPGLDKLAVLDLAWDVEVAQALGAVVPRTCTRLALNRGSLALTACVQLARSLPWLEVLCIHEMRVRPHAICMLVGALCSLVPLPGGRPMLNVVHVCRPVRPEDMSEDVHRAQWELLHDDVAGMGAGVELRLYF